MISWPPESRSRVGYVLALRPSSGAEEPLMPGNAAGRVAAMPRLGSSLESTDLDPVWWKLGGCHPMPVPKETEAKTMRQIVCCCL